mmetsp:Transcript_10838/g.14350  ORF Transcript_10838/g.14350 Transcript_10838/m.14350 type:complete len:222 (+) Transcript_10838:250-915(+)
MESFAQLCANLAPWAASVVFLAPYPTIQKIMSEKSVGNLPLMPYTSMIGSAFLWATYGVLKSDVRIWSTNVVGLVLGLYYFFSFCRHAPKSSPTLPGSLMAHVQVILAIVCGTSLVATMSPSTNVATRIIGFGSVCLSVALFGSPLSVLKVVLETKSAASIPLPFTIACFINCFLWSVFGVAVAHDVYVIVPNVLGFIFSIVQIGLKLKFGDSSKFSALPT